MTYVEGEALVILNDDATIENLQELIPSIKVKRVISNRVYLLTFEDLPVIDEIELLQNSELVKCADPNYIRKGNVNSYTPNDSNFFLQWGLQNRGQNPGGIVGCDINICKAWNLLKKTGRTIGSSSLGIGIIDTGINYNHPDLVDNFHDGSDSINEDYDPMDDNGHGTHIAGIIAAVGDNTPDISSSIGIAGIIWDCSLRITKALDANMHTTDDAITVGIINMCDCGFCVKIINMSFGSYDYSKTLHDLIEFKSNVLFVCATGNDCMPDVMYPAGFDLANIISVGASDYADNICAFSNYHATKCDVFAPGKDIISTEWSTPISPDNTYQSATYYYESGTSMAAPHVTGVAALLLHAFPSMTAAQIKSRIMNTVDVKPAFSGKCVSGGRLNAYAALTYNDGGSNYIVDEWTEEDDIIRDVVRQSPVLDTPHDGIAYNRTDGQWTEAESESIQIESSYLLPENPEIGKTIEIIGTGTPWIVVSSNGKTIIMGSDETIANGTINADDGYNTTTFIYIGNGKWNIKYATGTFTLDKES